MSIALTRGATVTAILAFLERNMHTFIAIDLPETFLPRFTEVSVGKITGPS